MAGIINLLCFVVLQVFSLFYVYFGISLFLTILYLIFDAKQISSRADKIIFTFLYLTAGIFAFELFQCIKDRKTNKRLRFKWQKIKYESSSSLPQQQSALDNLSKSNKTQGKISTFILNTFEMPVIDKNICNYYTSSKSYYEDLLKEIKSAKKYILIEASKIENGQNWQDIFNVLKQKALQGIEIKILYDENKCLNSFKDKFTFSKLRNHRIETIAYNPVKLFNGAMASVRDNSNMCIIDGNIAIISTLNITDKYINAKKSGVSNLNGIKVCGDSVWGFILIYFGIYRLFTNSNLNVDKYKGINAIKTKNKDKQKCLIQPLFITPFRKLEERTNFYSTLISNAKESVTIVTNNLIFDENFESQIIALASSGVEIKIVINNNAKGWKGVFTKASIERLIKQRVKIFRSPIEAEDYRIVLIDNEYALIGGADFDFRRSNVNFECGVMVYNNSEIMSSIKADLDKSISNCYLLTLKDVNQRKLKEKVGGLLLKYFSPLM